MHLMWLIILTAKSWTIRFIGWIKIIYVYLEPTIKKVWSWICDVSPKIAVYAEKIPYIGNYIAWFLSQLPQLDQFYFLEKAFCIIKRSTDDQRAK